MDILLAEKDICIELKDDLLADIRIKEKEAQFSAEDMSLANDLQK
jgi:hypothetical protein